MEWYYIVLIVILSLLLIILLISYICYKMTFYSNNNPYKRTDEITIPKGSLYEDFKDVIVKDVMYARSFNPKEYEIISFDNLTLKAKYYEYKKGAPIEIMLHGYRGYGERDMSTGVRRAFECERNALVVDQRASGYSEGKIITFGVKECKDCLSWVDFVIKEFGNDVKIILTGVSMGAATVCNASGCNLPKNVVGVLADCGYNDPGDIIKKVIVDMHLPPKLLYPFIKLGARIFGHFNLEEMTPNEQVKKAQVPIIFYHGGKDELVPHHMSKKLYDACASRKKFVTIEEAKHGISYIVEPIKYVTELKEFFKDIK